MRSESEPAQCDGDRGGRCREQRPPEDCSWLSGFVVGDEPARERPAAALSLRMSRLARTDTAPELALRRALHARGLRYRVQVPVPGLGRRRIDVAFTRVKLAVFVDGCFWHGCPVHGMIPATNNEWWTWKISRNRERDADTTSHLHEQGWTVLRVWEHTDVPAAASQIENAVHDLGRAFRRV